MLAARLFGLELDVIQSHCTPSEVSKFKLLALWFLLLIACTLLSMTYFFYLLSESIVLAPILGAVITFVFFSIFRFSLISISIPLHEEFTWKSMLSNSGNILRMFVISFFLTAIAFPLTAFLFSSKMDGEVESYKAKMLDAYQIKRQKSIKQATQYMDADIQTKLNEIKTLERQLQIGDSLDNYRGVIDFKIAKIREELIGLNIKKVTLVKLKQQEVKAQIDAFRSTLVISNLPIIRCVQVLKLKNAKIFIVFFILFFLAIIPIYIKQLSEPNSNYAKNYIDKIKSHIIIEFTLSAQQRKKHLAEKFGHTKEEVVLYEDIPFNVKPVPVKSVEVIGIDLFTHFNDEAKSKGSI
jgi:hypothetical protein